MKYLVLTLSLLASQASAAESVQTCSVQVCNKIERLSLDIFSHIKDSIGEVCFDVVLPKSEAVVGKVLSAESRWYQGSNINPTKQSVTKVKQVYSCTE